MIGQLPPFALSTPTFRFRALASHAGRASLGGDREIALACFMVARLAAGVLPPVMLAPADAATRLASARNWLSALTLPAPVRMAVTTVIDAIAAGDHSAAAESVRGLSAIVGAQLDQGSLGELRDVADDLANGPSRPRAD